MLEEHNPAMESAAGTYIMLLIYYSPFWLVIGVNVLFLIGHVLLLKGKEHTVAERA